MNIPRKHIYIFSFSPNSGLIQVSSMRINKLQLISKLLPAVAFIFIGSVTQGATIVLGQSLKCFKDNICKKKVVNKKSIQNVKVIVYQFLVTDTSHTKESALGSIGTHF